MIQRTWDEIPAAYPGVEIDAFIVMPNHIHGVVFLIPQESDLYPTIGDQPPSIPVGAPPRGRPRANTNAPDLPQFARLNEPENQVSTSEDFVPAPGRPRGGAPTESTGYQDPETTARRLSLSDVVERYKSLTTHRYRLGVRDDGWPPSDGKLWQRNYYERIVRNEYDLEKFRRYIEANPSRWFEDPYRASP